MMLNCRELMRILASDQLADARWSEKSRARLHMLLCRHCRRYWAQLRGLGVAARGAWRAEAQDSETLKRLQSKFREGSPNRRPDRPR